MKEILQKRTKHTISWSIFLSVILAALPSLAQTPFPQEECQIGCPDGPGIVPLPYGCYGECYVLQTESDNYSFVGSAGDDILVSVRGKSNYYDPRVEIRDPDGILILDEYCSGASSGPCSMQHSLLLSKSGAYLVKMSDQGINDPGTYVLQMERIPPVYNPPGLGYDSPVLDSVNPEIDMDFLDFEGVAGTDIRINVRGRSNYYDPRIEVWAPDGTPMVDEYCAGPTGGPCTFQVDDPELSDLPQTGTYLVAVSDQGINDEGGYELSLTCLYGPCPICTDNDADGYGAPASPNCTNPEWDCDDTDADVNPGKAESIAVGNCADGKDNDCDGLVDTDPECAGGTCTGSAEASTYEASPVYGSSDLSKHLAYLVLPLGALIGIMIWRRKR